jgi:hypothetical protein
MQTETYRSGECLWNLTRKQCGLKEFGNLRLARWLVIVQEDFRPAVRRMELRVQKDVKAAPVPY